MRTAVRSIALALAVLPAACGGGTHGSATPSGIGAASIAGAARATLTLHIPAPLAPGAAKRGVRYVPSTTDQMVVTASDGQGSALPQQQFDLSANSAICSSALNSGARTCTVQILAPISVNNASDAIVVTLNATVNGSGEVAVATGTETGVVTEGAANVLPPLVLNGVVASGSIFPQARGYPYGAASVPLIVTARDASFNTIIGGYDASGQQVMVKPTNVNSTLTVDNGNGNTATITDQQSEIVTSSSSTIDLNPPPTSTGNIVEVLFQGGAATTALTMVQPNAMPSNAPIAITSGYGPPAGTPFVQDSQFESETWISQNAIWRYSEAAAPQAFLVCSSFTSGGQTIPLYPDSAVQALNGTGVPTNYFLAGDAVYQVDALNDGVCNVENINGADPPNAGHLRNLRVLANTGQLVMNSDNFPVVSLTPGANGVQWGTYGYPVAPANSHPDGIAVYPDSDTVAFSDSAGGVIGVVELDSSTFAENTISAPVSALTVDAVGDIGYLYGTEAYIWHPAIDGSEGTYFAPYDVGTVGIGVSLAFSTVGHVDNSYELWAVDANGVLTSYAVPYTSGYGAPFGQGQVSSTPLAAAGAAPTALGSLLYSATGITEGQLVLGSASAIVTYPSTALVQNLTAKHRAPRVMRR